MDTELSTPLLVTVAVAIIGWYVVHRLSSNQEREAKRREMIVQYLISAWRKLENAAQRDEPINTEVESAIADIQLFVPNNWIELAHEAAGNLAEKGGANFDNLLETLRNNLREELKLEKAIRNISYLRIGKQAENKLER
jgi:hypothetical protein